VSAADAAGHDPASRSASDLFRHYVGDLVYGANDGLVTTFTVVSGVAGAGLPVGVLVAIGVVNLAADGFSMGASNFLAIRSASAAEGRPRGFREPLAHAAATFVSFVVAGAVPLFAFFLQLPPDRRFAASAAGTAIALFTVGALRSRVVPGGALRCGLEMLVVGAVASAVAFAAGRFMRSWPEEAA
jgi:VIT1/CCC1 family predicted Fe2+/Mn2+ transporter